MGAFVAILAFLIIAGIVVWIIGRKNPSFGEKVAAALATAFAGLVAFWEQITGLVG